MLKLKIIDASFRRNGIRVSGFSAIILEDIFAEGNSWRGDRYEAEVRPLLEQWLAKERTNRAGPFAF